MTQNQRIRLTIKTIIIIISLLEIICSGDYLEIPNLIILIFDFINELKDVKKII